MKFVNQIDPSSSLLECLKKMDAIGKKLLILTKGQKFVGILSIGDIQRAILNQNNLNSEAHSIQRKIITLASIHDSKEEIKSKMLELRTECMPVLDDDGNLQDVIFWEDIFLIKKPAPDSQIDNPVIIMAGGKGTRLKPFTNIFPKPLMPYEDTTILETIIDSFIKEGCKQFFISVNYKAELIQYYLDTQKREGIEITLFKEGEHLGTAGSLHLLKGKFDKTFFVTNCDILIDQNYFEILDYHKETKNELTIVGVLKHYSIPYGTMEIGKSGMLQSITEKPEFTYLINSGLYILEPHLINELPINTFYHITTLIKKLKEEERRVGVFPVNTNSWKDFGEWKEYLKFISPGK